MNDELLSGCALADFDLWFPTAQELSDFHDDPELRAIHEILYKLLSNPTKGSHVFLGDSQIVFIRKHRRCFQGLGYKVFDNTSDLYIDSVELAWK